ncbi:hypothetical protein [Pelagibacterium lacus]|uniref:hypothetical protein n=1 Tax=Pelagibacterium lacus TaxID=2282655 RepID=UPI0011C05553|nr:hypothetical protein [Pelagibacterium lacus]
MTSPALPYAINLLDDGSVVTADGEYLGTWDAVNDAIYEFTPDGQDRPVISGIIIPFFCKDIEAWRNSR